MYMPTSVQRQHLAIHGAVLFAILIPLYYFSWQYHTAHPWRTSSQRAPRPPSTDFVGDWLDVHVVEPFNPSAIGAYCNATKWRPNLVFRIDNVNGSIEDVRGNVADFLFFALEAGASIILPDVSNRDQRNPDREGHNSAPFDTLFDEEWFIHAMSEACPQMGIYKSPDLDTLPEALPAKYIPLSVRTDILPDNSRKAYREHLDSWLKSQPAYSTDQVTLVDVEIFSTLWKIDTRSLPPSFRRSLPQVIRTNPSIRRVAALVAQSLSTQHPSMALDPRDAIPLAAFYGALLDIPDNPPQDKLPHSANANFSTQTDAYIAHALSLDLPLVYAASSNSSTLALFRDKAAHHNPPLSVVTKTDLIPFSALQELEDLSSDQKMLVDYELLLRCSVFAGFVNSTLAFNVALTRAQRREDEAWVGDPWRIRHLVSGLVFDDGVSRIVGRDGWREERLPRGMWP
ncbi:hypothetical protein Q7P37_011313 [Cladosporium fusiforme]